jgi:peptidoglycan/xylan/chitin deacetylase (PgdA/CDA1 family)
LRRLLLELRVPSQLLRLPERLLGSGSVEYRWHAFLYTLFYWRGVRRVVGSGNLWKRMISGTPILLYHAVGDQNEPASRYVVPGRRFRSQMRWLRLWYRVLSLPEYLEYRRDYLLPPPRSVVVTLDDGYADNRTVAYPILRRFKVPATIFLVSDYLGDSNGWDRDGELAGRALLSPHRLEEMGRNGINFGAHTRSHAHLRELPVTVAVDEIAGSREDLERLLGTPIQTFAYPYGQFNEEVLEIVGRTGFEAACGTREGLNTPATPTFALRRAEIRGTDSLFRFALALWLGETHHPVRRGRS